jgi:hypothetical protein
MNFTIKILILRGVTAVIVLKHEISCFADKQKGRMATICGTYDIEGALFCYIIMNPPINAEFFAPKLAVTMNLIVCTYAALYLLGQNVQLGHNRFLSRLFQFVIRYHQFMRCYVTEIPKSRVGI